MNMINTHLKILIVDDTEIVLERLFDMIAELDSVDSVLKSNSYNQTVELIKQQAPDVILVDLQLPGKNGIELLKYVKRNYPAVKTIIVTNSASEFYRDLCNSLGADYFIDKSTEFEKIPGIIEAISMED
jgi:DNA-binding NarL/FixJ family response regulator